MDTTPQRLDEKQLNFNSARNYIRILHRMGWLIVLSILLSGSLILFKLLNDSRLISSSKGKTPVSISPTGASSNGGSRNNNKTAVNSTVQTTEPSISSSLLPPLYPGIQWEATKSGSFEAPDKDDHLVKTEGYKVEADGLKEFPSGFISYYMDELPKRGWTTAFVASGNYSQYTVYQQGNHYVLVTAFDVPLPTTNNNTSIPGKRFYRAVFAYN